MTQTRSQRGLTPRKTEHPGYVETPTRRRSGPRTARKSLPQFDGSSPPDIKVEDIEEQIEVIPEHTNGHQTKANGHVAGKSRRTRTQDFISQDGIAKTDNTHEYEFGGPLGVSAMMIGFPLLMYYMWIGATYFDGKFPWPAPEQSVGDFLGQMGRLVYNGAFPNLKALAMYWTFYLVEAIFYVYLPGIYVKGKPLPHEGGKQLDYYCSGVNAWYLTIAVAVGLHISGIFPMYTILDEFGPIMTVAIFTGYLMSFVLYISALARGVQHRMTGNHVYDFFMGAELNPRILGILDFKMFLEVRIPWFMLFLTSLSAAARQYEDYGYVSGEVAFLVMAHWLYANACAKAEEMITTTWDMYYEKLGFMLTFWNLAGVPLSYCHCTIYLANHPPSEYQMNRYALGALYVAYLFVYWVWDTANGQKNRYRHEEKSGYSPRKAFPQLPWGVVNNPNTIASENGGTIFVDGWFAYARKIHYTCDIFFAVSWGLVTGFKSPFPWFYPIFFCIMISHRIMRDIERCRERYGKAWKEYERRVPYLFIPYVI